MPRNARPALRLAAPAKINEYLRIGRRRPDGYHLLETIFQEIDLCDVLEFSPSANTITLTVEPPVVTDGPDNLVVKALERLRARLGVGAGLRVRLIKRIPDGAGLGGGSSDAASALWGGWLLWTGRPKPKRPPPVLVEIARTLGADVPFFLTGGRARATGTGDRLRRMSPGRNRWLIVVFPGVKVATKDAYAWLDAARRKGLRAKEGGQGNSFEPVVFSRMPAVAAAFDSLIQAGCRAVRMSGSGSAVFGFASSRAAAVAKATRLKRRGWKIFVASTRGNR